MEQGQDLTEDEQDLPSDDGISYHGLDYDRDQVHDREDAYYDNVVNERPAPCAARLEDHDHLQELLREKDPERDGKVNQLNLEDVPCRSLVNLHQDGHHHGGMACGHVFPVKECKAMNDIEILADNHKRTSRSRELSERNLKDVTMTLRTQDTDMWSIPLASHLAPLLKDVDDDATIFTEPWNASFDVVKLTSTCGSHTEKILFKLMKTVPYRSSDSPATIKTAVNGSVMCGHTSSSRKCQVKRGSEPLGGGHHSTSRCVTFLSACDPLENDTAPFVADARLEVPGLARVLYKLGDLGMQGIELLRKCAADTSGSGGRITPSPSTCANLMDCIFSNRIYNGGVTNLMYCIISNRIYCEGVLSIVNGQCIESIVGFEMQVIQFHEHIVKIMDAGADALIVENAIDEVHLKAAMFAVLVYSEHTGIVVPLSISSDLPAAATFEGFHQFEIEVRSEVRTQREQQEHERLEHIMEVPAHSTERIDFMVKAIGFKGAYEVFRKVSHEMPQSHDGKSPSSTDGGKHPTRPSQAEKGRDDDDYDPASDRTFCVASEERVLGVENHLVFEEDSRATTDATTDVRLFILTECTGSISFDVIEDYGGTDLVIVEATHNVSAQRYAIWCKRSVTGQRIGSVPGPGLREETIFFSDSSKEKGFRDGNDDSRTRTAGHCQTDHSRHVPYWHHTAVKFGNLTSGFGENSEGSSAAEFDEDNVRINDQVESALVIREAVSSNTLVTAPSCKCFIFDCKSFVEELVNQRGHHPCGSGGVQTMPCNTGQRLSPTGAAEGHSDDQSLPATISFTGALLQQPLLRVLPALRGDVEMGAFHEPRGNPIIDFIADHEQVKTEAQNSNKLSISTLVADEITQFRLHSWNTSAILRVYTSRGDHDVGEDGDEESSVEGAQRELDLLSGSLLRQPHGCSVDVVDVVDSYYELLDNFNVRQTMRVLKEDTLEMKQQAMGQHLIKERNPSEKEPIGTNLPAMKRKTKAKLHTTGQLDVTIVTSDINHDVGTKSIDLVMEDAATHQENQNELDREHRELVCAASCPEPMQDVTIAYFIQQGREQVHPPVEPVQRFGSLHRQQVESYLPELDRELPDPVRVAHTLDERSTMGVQSRPGLKEPPMIMNQVHRELTDLNPVVLETVKSFPQLKRALEDYEGKKHEEWSYDVEATSRVKLELTPLSVLSKLLPVERPLLRPYPNNLDKAILRGIQELSWGSEGADECIDEAMDQMNIVGEIFQAMQDSMETTNEIIKEGVKAILAPLKEINKVIKVVNTAPNWVSYINYTSNLVVSGLSCLVTGSLEVLMDQLDQELIAEKDLKPLVQVKMDPAPKMVQFPPAIITQRHPEDQGPGQGAPEAIVYLGGNFVQAQREPSNHVQRELRDLNPAALEDSPMISNQIQQETEVTSIAPMFHPPSSDLPFVTEKTDLAIFTVSQLRQRRRECIYIRRAIKELGNVKSVACFDLSTYFDAAVAMKHRLRDLELEIDNIGAERQRREIHQEEARHLELQRRYFNDDGTITAVGVDRYAHMNEVLRNHGIDTRRYVIMDRSSPVHLVDDPLKLIGRSLFVKAENQRHEISSYRVDDVNIFSNSHVSALSVNLLQKQGATFLFRRKESFMIVGDHGYPLTTVEDLNLLEIEIKIGTRPQREQLIDEKAPTEFMKEVLGEKLQLNRSSTKERFTFDEPLREQNHPEHEKDVPDENLNELIAEQITSNKTWREQKHPEFLKDVPEDNWQRSRALITEQLVFEDQKIDTEGVYDINETLPQLQTAKHALDPQELQREFENAELVEIRAALGPFVFWPFHWPVPSTDLGDEMLKKNFPTSLHIETDTWFIIDLNHSHLSVPEIPLMSLCNGSRFRVHISTPIRPHCQHPSPLSRDGGLRDPARAFADPSSPPAAEGASSPSSAEEDAPSPATQVSGPSPSSAMVDDGGNSPPSLGGGTPGLVPGKSPSPTGTGEGNSASAGHTVIFTGASPHEEHVDLSGTIMETKLYFRTAIRVHRYLPTSSRYEEQYEQYTEEIFIIRDDKFKLDNDQQPRADTRVDVISDRVRAGKQRGEMGFRTSGLVCTVGTNPNPTPAGRGSPLVLDDAPQSDEAFRKARRHKVRLSLVQKNCRGDDRTALLITTKTDDQVADGLTKDPQGCKFDHFRDIVTAELILTSRDTDVSAEQVRAGEQLGDIGEAVSLVSTAQAGSLHRVSGGEGYALVHRDASSKPSNYNYRHERTTKQTTTTTTPDDTTTTTTEHNDTCPTTCHGCKMEGGVNEGRSISNCTPGTNGIVPGTSRIVRTLIPVTTGTPDKSTLSQRNAHDLDEPRRTTSCRNYSTEGGLAEGRSAPEGVRLVLGILMARTEITPRLVSTSDESTDSRPKSRGNSIVETPDTYHTNAIIRACTDSSFEAEKDSREPDHRTASPSASSLITERPLAGDQGSRTLP